MERKTKRAVQISDDAVQAKTGKTWPEWFAILDAAGGVRMSHKEIVAFLSEKYGAGPWWQQMITVAYEQKRGKRQKYETPTGFQASASKTIAVPLAVLYKAWKNKAIRKRWFSAEAIGIRKATPNKSMRITWSDGKTSVDVNFDAKGDSKSQVTVEHRKLASVQQVARMKTYWAKALDTLKAFLEMKSKGR